MFFINQNGLLRLIPSSRKLHPQTYNHFINLRRGAKMWVPVPEKIKPIEDNVAPLLDCLRLVKAIKINQPDLPIELTIEPLMKKTVNSNVLKGRFTLPHPIPPSCSPTNSNESKRDVIAVVLDEQSTEDVKLAKKLGADYVGGQDLLDKIIAEQIKPTKLLVHSKTPRIKNLFTSSESKKTLFKTLTRLSLIIPSEKRGTISEDLNELIMNSSNSIDWMVKKKQTFEEQEEKDQEQAESSSSFNQAKPKVKNNNKKSNEMDSFISIPVGSIQMNLIELERNISDFLSMISNLTQFGTTNPTSTIPTTKSDLDVGHQFKTKNQFKSGRPIKRPGIHKATLSVTGIPSITVI